eukprot:scaffold1070_cov245-Pinguiococcus_pyrenoidosus.AAC.26
MIRIYDPRHVTFPSPQTAGLTDLKALATLLFVNSRIMKVLRPGPSADLARGVVLPVQGAKLTTCCTCQGLCSRPRCLRRPLGQRLGLRARPPGVPRHP